MSSTTWYITGTTIRVRKVAKMIPAITAIAIGPHHAAWSPPQYRSGVRLPYRPKKSKLSPIASGTSPSAVVTAVSTTGRKRVMPPSTSASRRFTPSRARRMSM